MGSKGRSRSWPVRWPRSSKRRGLPARPLTALTLFAEAAQKETATVELVRRVIQKVEGAGR